MSKCHAYCVNVKTWKTWKHHPIGLSSCEDQHLYIYCLFFLFFIFFAVYKFEEIKPDSLLQLFDKILARVFKY